MSVARGDVVLVDFPFAGGGPSKVRPALVVQNNRDNQRLANTVVAMITSRTSRALAEQTQLLIDLSAPDNRQSGLLITSAVNCASLFTLDRRKILRRLGHLPSALMTKADACLKSALDLP